MKTNQLPPSCLPEGVDAPKARSPQATEHSGQLNTTNTLPQFTGDASPKRKSSSATLPDSQMSLFDPCQYQTFSYLDLLVRISALRELAPGLKAIAANCFLKGSDFCDSSSLVFSYLKMSKDCSPTTTDKPSAKLSPRLRRWGIWGLGSSATETDTSPKTDRESSAWVFTGDVRCQSPIAGKKSLKECLQGDVIPVRGRPDRGLWQVNEAPTLLAAAEWVFKLDVKRHSNSGGAGFAVLYRAPSGDRLFPTQAPTLRSLASTNGHQAGSGAVKVREFQGELYYDRPLLPQEAEALMGWEPNSTALGIDAAGREIAIAATNRHKVLGNGIIPQEVTEILGAIKSLVLAARRPELICYIDEVGYGACFGPPVVCALILRSDSLPRLAAAGVTDSKKLSPKRRQALLALISECAITARFGYATVDEVNSMNIREATSLAMRRAIAKLPVAPTLIRVDGRNTIPGVGIPQQAIEGGDATDIGIAAASILAKEWRDALLTRLGKRYPGYGLAQHKGYCVPAHRQGIARLGATRLHHANNKYVREAIANG